MIQWQSRQIGFLVSNHQRKESCLGAPAAVGSSKCLCTIFCCRMSSKNCCIACFSASLGGSWLNVRMEDEKGGILGSQAAGGCCGAEEDEEEDEEDEDEEEDERGGTPGGS